MHKKSHPLDILVIAAHPDDEVLGMGGTIKKLVKNGNKVHLCVVTEGASAQYSDKKMIDVRKKLCLNAGKFLGITTFSFLDFPDMKLDSFPQLEINKKLEEVIKKINPTIIYTTPPHDLNKDHRLVFDSTLISARPMKSNVKSIFAYEIPGLTKEQFCPNVYENITHEIKNKIKAFQFYESEVMKFPNPRSVKAIESLALLRGVESGLLNAEAFRLIRAVS